MNNSVFIGQIFYEWSNLPNPAAKTSVPPPPPPLINLQGFPQPPINSLTGQSPQFYRNTNQFISPSTHFPSQLGPTRIQMPTIPKPPTPSFQASFHSPLQPINQQFQQQLIQPYIGTQPPMKVVQLESTIPVEGHTTVNSVSGSQEESLQNCESNTEPITNPVKLMRQQPQNLSPKSPQLADYDSMSKSQRWELKASLKRKAAPLLAQVSDKRRILNSITTMQDILEEDHEDNSIDNHEQIRKLYVELTDNVEANEKEIINEILEIFDCNPDTLQIKKSAGKSQTGSCENEGKVFESDESGKNESQTASIHKHIKQDGLKINQLPPIPQGSLQYQNEHYGRMPNPPNFPQYPTQNSMSQANSGRVIPPPRAFIAPTLASQAAQAPERQGPSQGPGGQVTWPPSMPSQRTSASPVVQGLKYQSQQSHVPPPPQFRYPQMAPPPPPAFPVPMTNFRQQSFAIGQSAQETILNQQQRTVNIDIKADSTKSEPTALDENEDSKASTTQPEAKTSRHQAKGNKRDPRLALIEPE